MPTIVPAVYYLPSSISGSWLQIPNSVIRKIGIEVGKSSFERIDDGYRTYHVLHFLDHAKIDLPLIPGTSLEFEPDRDNSDGIGVSLCIARRSKVEITNLALRLTFSPENLPAFVKNVEGYYVPINPTADMEEGTDSSAEKIGLAIDINLPLASVDLTGNINFDTPTIGIPYAAQIGSTGVFIDFNNDSSDNAVDLILSDNNLSYSASQALNSADEVGEEQFDENEDEDFSELVNEEGEDAGNLPSNFRGIRINHLSITYQTDDLKLPPLSFIELAIGNNGFWGKLYVGTPPEDFNELELSSEHLNSLFNDDGEVISHNMANVEEASGGGVAHSVYPANIFGMRAALQYVGIEFVQNVPESGSIRGFVFMPLAEKWFSISASLGGPNADFMLDVGGTADAPLISLEHDYFEIKADSIAYKLDDGIHYAAISGSIKPKIEGFDWPEMKIQDLSVSSEGDISIPGGWITAPETITLNFSAFKIGIDEIGFGNQEPEEDAEDQRTTQWLGFSGELNLVEGLDLKASVEGLKFSWPKGGGPIKTTLKGIEVNFEIPNTLTFKGSVNYEELTSDNNNGTGLTGKLFKGNIDLELTSIRMAIEAELIIGKLVDADGNQFTSFFIILGADLPAGIPLGATGTSLYGVKGLGAMNVGPTKTDDQSWYQWYMAAPERDITSINKYRPLAGYNAFGAGVTLGTAFDDGFTLNMSVMLAVLLPGPIIVLEGKANLLKQRLEGAQEQGGPEGAFYLLAVMDGRAGTFMLNVDVKYSLKDIITVGASLEAFFDFNDSSKWYVYIGRKPEEKRVRAEILSLFGANTYFMIDNSSFKTGASIGFDFRKKYGPAKVFLVAKIGFDAAIFWQPMQVEGALAMEAGLGVSVFGIGLELYLAILLEGKVPQPYWIHGVGQVGIKLFWPLPDVKFKVELEWRQDGETQPAWPLLKDCTFTHHKGSSINIKIPILSSDAEQPIWDNFPVVPVDSRPVLNFARPVHNLELGPIENPIPIFKTTEDNAGGTIFKYKLDMDGLVLQRYDFENQSWFDVKKGINRDDSYEYLTEVSEVRKFIVDRNSILNTEEGIDPNEPKIQLWKTSARDHTNRFTREEETVNHPACPPRRYQQYIDINWVGVDDETIYDFTFSYAGLQFVVNQSRTNNPPTVIGQKLWVRDNVTIHFPEPVFLIGIETFGIIKAEMLLNGEHVGDMDPRENSFRSTQLVLANTLHLHSTDFIFSDRRGSTFSRVLYLTQSAWLRQQDRTDSSPAAEEEKINGELVLEPATFYRLTVKTAVDINDDENKKLSSDFIYFRTDEGPNIDSVKNISSVSSSSKELEYKGKPVNQFSTYIDRTLPRDGALTHYLDYDVGLQFNETYVEKLFRSEKISIRYKDRNDKLLSYTMGDFLTYASFLPQFPAGLLSYISNAEHGDCLESTTQTPNSPYLNFPSHVPFKANRLYSAEVFVNVGNEEQILHSFQFSSSRYKSFRAHVLGAGENETMSPIDLPAQRLEGTHNIRPFVNQTTDLKASIDDFYNNDAGNALVKNKLLEKIKSQRHNLDQSSNELFKKIELAFISALDQINMTDRPLPEKFEIFRIPFSTHSRLCLLLIESPEPIDWLRVSASVVGQAGRKKKIYFVWNKDKTRAFIVRPSVHTFQKSDRSFKFTFTGAKDPITGTYLSKNEIVKEDVEFSLV